MGLASIKAAISHHGLSLYIIAVGCILLGPWNPDGIALCELSRSGLKSGEYWRFWTGQMVHSSWESLSLSLVGLILLQQMFGKELRTVVWVWGYAVISLVVGVCMLAFSRYGNFVGLSAILHGLFAYAACLAFRRDGLLAAGLLLVLGGKVIWEKLQGGANFMEQLIGIPVAVDANLYGFAAGLVLGAVMVASGSRLGQSA
ncbi:MAG: rhombosortase [Gammaproteobacteria bacterium]|nr:rhombosortase [Gammaproteobacteria bacterium]MCP4091102.1 rhombosortase [Gammaproteobacteria bacterium]MCP4277372.1 rhombosortase [Gammaproteobacteria bacterium]MCP4831567.1 rhombosortase [Gammaproteobacteria bacterium]MCP4927790.1 rhombosortase [Gammaproteobacteria bacterium]